MKDRQDGARTTRAGEVRARLVDVLAALDDPAEVDAFLDDLCTPAEIEALADRWSVVPLLASGMSYRRVHEATGVSVTTVGRIARCLDGGAGGYRAALRHHPDHEQAGRRPTGHQQAEHQHPGLEQRQTPAPA